MVRVLTLALVTTALAGCASHPAPPPPAPIPVAAEATPEPAPLPKAQVGTYGFDSAGMDTSVRPGDDFYTFANGTWAKNTPIPPDKSNYGSFTTLQDMSQQRVRDILDAAKNDPNSRIGMAYSSFLDEAAVESKGLTPIQPWLDEIRGLENRSGYAVLAAHAARNGVGGLFAGGTQQDDRHSDVYITGLGQAGLGMPDRDMYLLPDANFVSLRTAYVDHLTKMLTLAGETNAAARARAIMAFETNIAKV